MGGIGSGMNQRGISRNAGVRNARAKLDPRKVVQICARYVAGETKAGIGQVFGVSADTVSKALERRSWPDVPRVGDRVRYVEATQDSSSGRVAAACVDGTLVVRWDNEIPTWESPEKLQLDTS